MSPRANEALHEHNERNFPQAKLDGEINARFLLNEYGDLYFLLHENSVHIILFILKKIKSFYRVEKRYRWKRAQNWHSGMQIMPAKTTTIRALYVHVVLNGVIFPQI